MSPSPPDRTIYWGQLRPKRKTELLEIAASLSLPTDSLSTKPDIEDAIRAKLSADPTLREDDRWRGLWAAIDRQRKARAIKGLDAATDDEHEDEDEEEGPGVAGTAVSPGSVASTSSTLVKRLVGGAVERIPGDQTAAPQTDVVALRNHSPGSLWHAQTAQSLVKATRAAETFVGSAQLSAHNAWFITAFTVVAELAFLAWEAVPWPQSTFGPHKWLLRSPTPAFSLPTPAPSVLLHPTFFHPLLQWFGLTVIVPLLFAGLFAFPRRSGRRYPRKPAPPNPVVFNLARITVAVLAHYIFKAKASAREWNFDQIDGYPAIQVLGSTLATVLCAYESSLSR